jgi:SH3-like domain-containing protein
MFRGRFALIAVGGAAILGAMLLIPGRENTVAVADTAAPIITDFTSQETIAAIDALLGPSAEPTPLANPEIPSGINPTRPAADPNLQTAALTTPAPATDLEGAPLVDPSLRPDSVGSSAVNLRAGPSSATATVTVLQPGQAVQTGESDGGWIEVTLPDGTTGWVYSRYLASNATTTTTASADPQQTTTASRPEPKATVAGKGNGDLQGRTARIQSALTARAKPNSGAATVFQTEPGERVKILDQRGDWLRIRTADGSSGWIKAG